MDVPLIRWDAPGPYSVVFSTRLGGVSEPPYESLNLGRLTGDDPDRVGENRRRLAGAAGVETQPLAYNRQVHGGNVLRAGFPAREADALWSDTPREPMVVFTADCLPVALARTNGTPALAAIHVGWRGLLGDIVERTAVALGGGAFTAVVGPGIGRCCYEVGDDVGTPFRARFGDGIVRASHLDLRAATERALRDAGATAVDHVELCTVCRGDLFFSHRRDGASTGRQGMLGYVA